MHWMARVPLAPQILDSWLLWWTALFDKEKLAAMEAVEAAALQLPGVQLCRHRFGGIGFAVAGREFGHIHGNGLLDVRLTREKAEAMIAGGYALPHHVFGRSAWVSLWVRSERDVTD